MTSFYTCKDSNQELQSGCDDAKFIHDCANTRFWEQLFAPCIANYPMSFPSSWTSHFKPQPNCSTRYDYLQLSYIKVWAVASLSRKRKSKSGKSLIISLCNSQILTTCRFSPLPIPSAMPISWQNHSRISISPLPPEYRLSR